jgi:sortase B
MRKNSVARQKPTKGEIIRRIIIVIASAVLVVCLALLGAHFYKSWVNQHRYDTIAKSYGSSAVSSYASASSSIYPAGMLAAFQSLYDKNHDVKGYIKIPGTKVDYPVMQSADNDYYLHHTFDRLVDDHAALFLDYRDKISPQSDNLIIYGHNMADGQMFGQLNFYQKIDTLKDSSVITCNTLYGNYKWKVFAVFMTNTEPKLGYVFNYLITDFSSDTSFNSFVNEAKARSMFNIPVDVKPGDKLLTLSTCAYELPDGAERFVIMARRVRDGESETVGAASVNNSCVGPTSAVK